GASTWAGSATSASASRRSRRVTSPATGPASRSPCRTSRAGASGRSRRAGSRASVAGSACGGSASRSTPPISDVAAPADVFIDTRPLWRILAGRTYRPTVLLLGLLAFFVVRAAPPQPGLPAAGQNALATFALCLVYWVTNVLPLMVTSLLA